MFRLSIVLPVLVAVVFPQRLQAQPQLSAAPVVPIEPVPLCSGDDAVMALAETTKGREHYARALRSDPPDVASAKVALAAFDRACAAGDSWALEPRAQVLVTLGRYLEAAESLDEFLLQHPPPTLPPEVKLRVADNEPRVFGRVGSVRVVTNAFNATVRIDDGQEHSVSGRPFRVMPGKHVLRLAAPGFNVSECEVFVTAGGSTDANVSLRPAYQASTDGEAVPKLAPSAAAAKTQDAPANLTPWAIACATAGVGLVIMGVVGTANSFSAANDYRREGCTMQSEDPQCGDLRRQFNLGRPMEIVGFAAGGALSVASIVILLAGSHADPAPRASDAFVRCGPGPGRVGLNCRGTF